MKIKDNLPKKPKTTQIVQGKVDASLFLSVKEKMKKDSVTWDDLLTAMFKVYLAE